MRTGTLLALALLLPAGPAPARAQEGFQSVVAPDTVTVGDRFRAALFTPLAVGSRLEVEVPADPAGRFQALGPVRVTGPTRADRNQARAEVTLVAWRTGPGGTLPAQARILAADGSVRRVAVRLRMPFVRSVLPADSANLQPKPPKDVYGVERDWRALLMIAGGLLLALAALLYYFLVLRKRRPKRRAVPPDARAAALAALERARASGLAERDVHAFYAEVSGALRRFAAAVDGGWSPHLTTTELIARMRERGVAPGEVEPLGRVLQTADLAKFARWPVGAEAAARDWGAARAWVQGFGAKGANGAGREGGR